MSRTKKSAVETGGEGKLRGRKTLSEKKQGYSSTGASGGLREMPAAFDRTVPLPLPSYRRIRPIVMDETFDDENFDSETYLASNTDVKEAVENGAFPSAFDHFDRFGRFEGRTFRAADASDLARSRARKLDRLKPFLRADLPHEKIGDTLSYLSDDLAHLARIDQTDAVSSHGYDATVQTIIDENPDGLMLDCGAGRRPVYFENTVNFEIVNYDTTDVIGVGEELPFLDDTFDAVFSIAVLEHVQDPFKCAAEIARVLKPGGKLCCAVPFLQPYHGYPHHYFNATSQGIRRLFSDHLEIDDVSVPLSLHPISSISWIIDEWVRGLPADLQESFYNMSLREVSAAIREPESHDFVMQLSQERQSILASGHMLLAHKQ